MLDETKFLDLPLMTEKIDLGFVLWFALPNWKKWLKKIKAHISKEFLYTVFQCTIVGSLCENR